MGNKNDKTISDDKADRSVTPETPRSRNNITVASISPDSKSQSVFPNSKIVNVLSLPRNFVHGKLLTKILNPVQGKYYNLDTKRYILKENVKGAYVNSEFNFATNDRKLYEEIMIELPLFKQEIITNPSFNHKYETRTAIPPRMRCNVWLKYNGNIIINGKCFCCKSPLDYIAMEMGHVNSFATNGNVKSEDDYRPLCGPCNKSMGKTNLFEYMKQNGYKNNY